MAIGAHGVVLTYEDYLALPNDGKRHEIIEGVLHMTAAPNLAHQRAGLRLAVTIDAHVRAHRLGELFIAPCDVLLSEVTVVQPDLVFVARGNESIVRPEHIRGAPDLVVEIVSPSTTRTDREVKLQVYAQYGVPHYWIVDPIAHQAESLALEAAAYRRVAFAQDDQVFAAPPFADLSIPLSELWH